VTEGFTVKLLIEGIGYKVDVKGNELAMALGLSHPVSKPIPASIKVTSDKGIITVTGSDKEEVTQFAAQIRALKKPEPYKGKGFRYDTEIIRRKQGKKSA
jgi:large subunit ribosomal protein L6